MNAKPAQLTVEVFRSEDSSQAEAQSEEPWPSDQKLEFWAQHCAKHLDLAQYAATMMSNSTRSENTEEHEKKFLCISIALLSPAEIQQLNSSYRAKDKPTNVLSFPQSIDPNEQAAFDELTQLPVGEIILCGEVIRQEASSQNKKLMNHWAHLAIHGTLHLFGYDHIDNAEANIMESLERSLLERINIEDPYQTSIQQTHSR